MIRAVFQLSGVALVLALLMPSILNAGEDNRDPDALRNRLNIHLAERSCFLWSDSNKLMAEQYLRGISKETLYARHVHVWGADKAELRERVARDIDRIFELQPTNSVSYGVDVMIECMSASHVAIDQEKTAGCFRRTHLLEQLVNARSAGESKETAREYFGVVPASVLDPALDQVYAEQDFGNVNLYLANQFQRCTKLTSLPGN